MNFDSSVTTNKQRFFQENCPSVLNKSVVCLKLKILIERDENLDELSAFEQPCPGLLVDTYPGTG